MRKIQRTLLLEITRLCNLRCEHCYHHDLNREKGANWQRFCLPEAFISQLGISHVVITGGEPLLEFSKLIRLSRYYSKFILDVELISNGILLTKNNISQLMEAGINAFAISLDTLHPVTFRRIRGVTLEPILANLRRMCDKDGLAELITLLVVLSKLNSNHEQIEQLLSLAHELGINRLKIQPITVLHLPQQIAQRYALNRIDEKLNEIKNLDPKRIITYHLPPNVSSVPTSSSVLTGFKCPIAKYLLYFDYKGFISPCPIRTDLLTDPWNEKYFEKEIINEIILHSPIECSLKTHCLCLFPEEGPVYIEH